MRLTQNMLYPSLTDRERFRGIDAKFSTDGTIVYTNNGNTSLTPRIQNLLKEKNNADIPILKFENGVLNVSKGASYRVSTSYHGLQTYSFNSKGASYWKPTYDMPEQDFRHFVSQDEFEDIYATNSLLSAFKSKTFDDFIYQITYFNPRTTTANELRKLGAPTGEFIKISKYEEEFMIDYDGLIFTKEDVEGLRDVYNNTDCHIFNNPPGTIYRIEGKDYTVDKNWRLTIPEGVICTPGRTEIIHPKTNE